mmetsp:Transcript_10469/g.34967  ORF Transcript_10469/g.34967 Transcript_10469/m.34967 type:complete len:176 (+) Transcript_10469:300-827(+)
MYHQIRKMIGLSILIIQAGLDHRKSIEGVFRGVPLPGKDKVSSFRLAPAEPLFLDHINFKYDKIKSFLENPSIMYKNDAFKRNTIIPHVYKESIKPILDFIQELSGSTGSDVHVLRKHMQKDEKHLLAQQKRDRQEAQRKQGSKEENEREMRREEQNKKLSKKEQRHLRRQQASA